MFTASPSPSRTYCTLDNLPPDSKQGEVVELGSDKSGLVFPWGESFVSIASLFAISRKMLDGSVEAENKK